VTEAPVAQVSFTKEPASQALECSMPVTESPVPPEPETQTSSHPRPIAEVQRAEPTVCDASPAKADAVDDDAESLAPSSQARVGPGEARVGPGDCESVVGSEYSDEFEFGSEADANLEEAEKKEEAAGKKDEEAAEKDEAASPEGDADAEPTQPAVDRASLRASVLHFETIDVSKERRVFNKLAKDAGHEILREQLQEALTMMDYRDVNAEWVEEFATQVIGQQSLLNFKEFSQLVTLYYEKHLDVLSEEFRVMDLDGNGNISAGEVAVHLERNGITVVPGIVRELLKEINGNQDSELCTIDAYVHLREIIQYRGGFTMRETEAMGELFKRYDADNSGTMDLLELESAIKWLGFSLREDEDFALQEGNPNLDVNKRTSFVLAGPDDDTLQLTVQDLIKGLDISNGGLSSQDFLLVMRRRRECEIRLLSQLFHDNNYSGCLSMEGVVTVFRKLGYRLALPEVVEEISKECRINHITQEGFYFDDVYVILQAWKRREGFLKADIQKYRDLFDMHDVDKSGNVDVVELGSIFRYLGIPVSEEEQLQIFETTDIDNSGEIDFDELLKAMRWFTEEEQRTLQRAFEEGDTDGNGMLDATEIKCLLPAIGYPKLTPEQAEIVTRETSKDLSFNEGVKLMKQLRDQAREDFNKRHGFTEEEIEGMQERFDAYDRRGVGYIANENLVHLLGDAFPEETRSKAGQAAIVEHLQTVDEDHNGKLEFNEFLALMRMVRDREMHEEHFRELDRAKEMGFTLDEMRNYRKIFRMCDSDASKEVDIDELLRMFATVVPMGMRTMSEIKHILEQVDEDGNKSLDFTEFLTVMRKAEDALKDELPQDGAESEDFQDETAEGAKKEDAQEEEHSASKPET